MKKTEVKQNVLLDAALKAYGIDKKYLLSHYENDYGTVTLLTYGGTRVSYSKDMKDINKLTDIQITGINPAPKKSAYGGSVEAE